ncbi:MBOAT family O-acyltransferase [Robertmurraya massiliosenegalensis]|uniref:MBOAT family O-acyltransferase n=1 Tax=Robertmurraya TaxID=2837507 RepID=UPI0039A54CC7
MLFNSFEFIFVFLPIVFLVYFYLNKKRLIIVSKTWLVFSSLFFYSWWNIAYLPLILTSLFFNYAVGSALSKDQTRVSRKAVLVLGIVFNAGLLGYFKYSDFFISNINALFTSNIALLKLALPLAISFFSFQQIAYLVDAYRKETKEYDFLNYAFFVTFFPQLIAGPIVHHKEMIPQLAKLRSKVINYKNISLGIFIFSIGLFKKVAIADTFAIWATQGFDKADSLTFFEGWITSLSFTFQLYFDFSGYTDMAIGAALLFNIVLPMNFNSPYKALDIQDFWRRWHITLSRFLTQYIYIPLGGSRKGEVRTYFNILIIFLISGFWHGAGWTFIFWGFLHGIASVVNRYWKKAGFKLNKLLAWFITFNFVNVAWVFFRATTWEDALKVLKGMLGFNGYSIPQFFSNSLTFLSDYGIIFSDFFLGNMETMKSILAIFIAFFISVFMKNSIQLTENFRPTFSSSIVIVFILVYSLLQLNKISEFLYFNF